MDKFRNDVAAAMGGKFTPDKAPEIKWYRVRKTWTDESSQLGAFEYLDRAKESCPYLYSVFDSEGKSVYTNKTKPKNTQASAFQGISEGKAAEMILELVKNNDTSGILYSVTAAQMILESGYIKTELAKAANNCFGMKETLSGNTWQSVWDGKSIVRIRTPEEYTPGVITYIYANFRKYPCIEDSIKDHSAYLLGAMNGSRKRYAGLTDCKNYREAISLIKSGGYATDSRYVDKICSIIQRYNLDRYDNEATPKPQPTPAPTPPKQHDFGDATCYVQTGAYKTEKYLKAHLEKLAEAGFSGDKVNPVVLEDGLTHVILGTYKLKRYAEKKKSLMWDAGFDAKIVDI
jgi:flagellum-specific peptidoglycan hydrolase FlgJ